MFFIGYSTPKELLANVPKESTFYADLVTVPGKTNNMGLRRDDMMLVVSVIPSGVWEDGKCHYWQMTVASKTDMQGQTLETNAEDRYAAAQAAAEILEDWLREQGIKLVHAMVARPLDYRFLDGTCDFMRFDKEQYTWLRVEPEPDQV